MVLWAIPAPCPFPFHFLVHFLIHLHLFLLPPLLYTSSLSVLVSSVQYARPLLIVRLKPSRRLAVVLSFSHFIAIGLLWPLTLPIMMKLTGSAMLAASLALYIRYFALLTSPQSVRGLKLTLDSTDTLTCTLETQRGDYVACALLGSSFVAPYLTVLELKPLSYAKVMAKISAAQRGDFTGWNRCGRIPAVARIAAMEVERCQSL